ncbi:glycosyltransferase family protein [Corallococcus silvisoli]|uniref:N-acetyl-alpha-D-glucosaminyl L-malate synthase BshA n=1 Tax=Corallococcus silvisoli TaxID=2697031 RepID=UPI00137776E3|nr:N-acetyl-alpha-D-glucosaminyl L-malate synthase BshA [Corallococcus silvisoli]NBD13440.1 hypothetical protein [Corallococcus silvisoli]
MSTVDLGARGDLLVHLSHEATRTRGGMGVVLEHLLAAPEYRQAFPRTLLVSPAVRPCGPGSYASEASLVHDLEAHGEVFYSGLRRNNPERWTRVFRPLEEKHDVSFVYGRRDAPGGPVEVLLVDVTDVLRGHRVRMGTLPRFLARLHTLFGVDLVFDCRGRRPAPWRMLSRVWRQRHGTRLGAAPWVNRLFRRAVRHGLVDAPPLDHDAMLAVTLAEPVFDALERLRSRDGAGTVLLAQEHLSLPLAYKALLDGRDWCRTVYYAGEVRTPRALVESGEQGQGASDARYYNIQRLGLEAGRTLDEVYPVGAWPSFQILRNGHLCDRVGAVSASVADELRFLDTRYALHPVTVVPHGHRPIETGWDAKEAARARVLRHARKHWGKDFRLLLTHIARDEVCKGLWRDVDVCEHLATLLPPERKPALLVMVTEWNEAEPSDNLRSVKARVEAFNAKDTGVHIALVNQPAWPEGLDFTRDDLHRATEVSLGQSLYESYGLAQLEALGCGAICVISGVSGARRALRAVCERQRLSESAHPNLVVADPVADARDAGLAHTVEAWKALAPAVLREQELRTAERVAEEVVRRLPRDAHEGRLLLATGWALSERLGWEPLIREQLLPLLRFPAQEEESALEWREAHG